MSSNQSPVELDEPADDLADDLRASDDDGLVFWPLVLVAAIGLVGYFLYDGLGAQTYFYTADEAVAQGQALVDQDVRIKGEVEAGTIEGRDGQLGRKFRIAENGKSIWVTYDRAMPDTFKEGVDVVAHGTVDDQRTLVADQVMVKCPSRYKGGPSHPDGVPKGPRASR